MSLLQKMSDICSLEVGAIYVYPCTTLYDNALWALKFYTHHFALKSSQVYRRSARYTEKTHADEPRRVASRQSLVVPRWLHITHDVINIYVITIYSVAEYANSINERRAIEIYEFVQRAIIVVQWVPVFRKNTCRELFNL